MEQLEKRQAGLLEQLADPGALDFASLNRELAKIQSDITSTESEWEEAAQKLEEIRLENERIHQEIK